MTTIYRAPLDYPRAAAEALANRYNYENAPDCTLAESWDDWHTYAVAEAVKGNERYRAIVGDAERYRVVVYTNDDGDDEAMEHTESGAEQDGCIGWL